MWAWRPSVHKKYPVYAQLVLIILLVHGVLLLPCFLLRHGQTPYHLNINTTKMNPNLPVVFVPLQESITANVSSVKQATSHRAKGGARKKNLIAKNSASKPKEQVKTVALTKKETKPKKVAAKKNNLPKQKAKKVEEQVLKQQVAQREVVQEKPEIKQVAAEQKPAQKEVAVPDALYVGRADLDQLAMQNAIQAILSLSWQPPLGLPEDLACQISFKIGNKGVIEELVMTKSSGILMYDIAVQSALYESGGQLPASSYGKEFCITFTQ